MSKKVFRPEDILADDASTTEMAGMTVRKGTIAAVIANTVTLESSDSSEAEKAAALAVIKELAPAVIAIGLHQHVTWKNEAVQKIFDETAG